ncbi:leucine-rich repeat receptor-like protein kinase TDR [Brachypodium distachyon]|uniref:non-specific serine/threonine protein kinase n=1 Tax=Brachypodium distachyon TaxID=15368 RepID=I1I1T1_BRADI|nr:leucine-rich repeat receptor-like protein kinase TDR [Brachypodium distachyon]KQJ95505.1 hypothetical protein BRADI_3g17567v3 [Brachypodium distachyon]|eukprot:XP_010236470.1 leucine-rich repeat receptor-like protein kinase TDR [Brachypodium distachyon]
MAATTQLPFPFLLLLPLLTITAASSAPLPLLALLALKSSLHDPAGALTPWTYASAASTSPIARSPPWCSWPGVSCSTADAAIVGIDLSRRNLSGSFSPTAAALLSPTLTSLNLSGNAFSGEFPPALLLLRRLVTLDVSHNFFNGTFPDGIARLGDSLAVVDAYSNCFVGPIPRGLGQLRQLERLNLGGSFFNGSIPPEFGKLRSLRFLHLAGNSLSGRLPPELGELALLERLELGYNSGYDGGIPPEFGGLKQLQYLDIAQGNLSGALPPELGGLGRLEALFLFKNRLAGAIPPALSRLQALRVLDLSDNRLTGPIPAGLGDLTNLTTLNLMSNSLSGSIPATIGELANLEVLQLWNNSLTGALPASLGSASRRLVRLDASTNSLSGPIPAELCAGGRLVRLILFANRLESSIPSSLASCASLWRVRLESNRLSGSIPAGFGKLKNLTYMDLSSNNLSHGGGIPPDLLACRSLEFLNVSSNPELGGEIPEHAWRAPRLQVFSASGCGLHGEIPAFSGGCANLYGIELGWNSLSGAIPGDVGGCRRLVSLRLQHNRLEGEIPASLESLPSVTDVDLSYNLLVGDVPPGFANSTTLETFDVSFNNLSSKAAPPVVGPGEIATTTRRTAAMWVSAVAVALAGLAVLALTARWLRCLEEEEDGGGSSGASGGGGGDKQGVGPWRMTAFQKLGFTAEDVARCVEVGGVVVGAGSSGTVYRAKMPNGDVIAVKKLWQSHKDSASPESHEAPTKKKRVVAEVEMLGQLRHRNIVRLLGWCTNAEGTSTMLLYEYMPNGSLHDLLHPENGRKKTSKEAAAEWWETRHRIAVGVAQGLSYLHHDCVPAVAHRDVKPSNILLDADLEARVADFGAAKALLHGDGAAMAMSTVAGSYGYMAPEYARTLRVDGEKSDVYSFGVVLLEIVTGRRAVEPDEFGEGCGIVDWARRKVAAAGTGGVWSEVMMEQGSGGGEGEREEMAAVLRVALLCTSRCPRERPSMRDVLAMLQQARPARNSAAAKAKAAEQVPA